MERTVYLRLYGRVQGIGFRRWVQKTAEKLGKISGWVRNVEDGSVEIYMCGQEEAIDQMILSCHQGPVLSRIDKISFQPPIIKGFLPDITNGRFEII